MNTPPLHVVVVDPWVATPSDIGPDRRSALTHGIAAAGHRVTVLAGRTSAAMPEHSPEHSSVTLKRNLSPLATRFGTPAEARPGRGYGLALYVALLRLDAPDVILLRFPPLKGALAAALYSAISGVPLALDVREIAPEKTEQGFFSKIMDRLRLSALRAKTAHVFAGSADIKAWFEAKGFAPNHISVCPDGCDTTIMNAAPEAAGAILQKYPPLLRGPLVVYAGSLNRGRRVSDVLDIAAAIRPLAPDLNFAIVGDGPDRLDLNAFAARLDVLEKNVWFIPVQTRSTVASLLSAATVVVALPPQNLNGGLEAGSHVFEGLAAGKPIAVVGDSWQRDMIEGRQAGVSLPSGNPEAAARELADFLRDGDLVRRAGEQAAALARGKHSFARVVVDMRQTLEKIAALHSRHDVMLRRFSAVKRALDIVLSASGLVILSPLFVIVAITMIAAGWLPLAGRARGGRRGKPFKLLTFDTTKADPTETPSAETWGHRFARILRQSALDRLPELLNVLAGQMSFVGPRPLPAAYTAYYTEAQLRRLDVRPGITGWAQVNGRNSLTWDEMFAHDLWYVNNRSFALDLKILWKTFIGVFRGKGAAPLPAGHLPRFDEIEARRQGAEDV